MDEGAVVLLLLLNDDGVGDERRPLPASAAVENAPPVE